MKRLSIFLLGLFVLLGLVWQASSKAQTQEHLRPVMKQKLELAKSLLESIAIEDYDTLAKNAQQLSLLNFDSGVAIPTTPKYLQYSKDFRRAATKIREGALNKDVDESTLGYVDLTMRCVECHKYLRTGGKLAP